MECIFDVVIKMTCTTEAQFITLAYAAHLCLAKYDARAFHIAIPPANPNDAAVTPAMIFSML
jgi:hypothetical protein